VIGMQERRFDVTPHPLPEVPRNRAQRRADDKRARRVERWLVRQQELQQAKLDRLEQERSPLARLHGVPPELILSDDPAIRDLEDAAAEQVGDALPRLFPDLPVPLTRPTETPDLTMRCRHGHTAYGPYCGPDCVGSHE
jgi:predicted ABC-type transport system involved in lysophospholipase L1 biosynthesis ATPase subunit